MKVKVIGLVLLVVSSLSVAMAQTPTHFKKHNFGLGIQSGYNLNNNGVVYGANALYEFRPFKKFGFTGGLTYDRTVKDMSGIWLTDDLFFENQVEQVLSANLGVRYHLGSVYLGTAFGLGYDHYRSNLNSGQHLNGGQAFGFYKSISAGYQFKLKNDDALEAEASLFGTRRTKAAATLRYTLRR